MFLPHKFQLFGCPTLTLSHNKTRFVDSVKYLGVYLRSTLTDGDDIARLVRYTFCCASMLKYRFYRCFRIVKSKLFRSCFTQANYGLSIPKMRYIGFVLLIMIVTHRQARSHWGGIRFALALELEFALVFELEFEFALEFDSHRNSHWGDVLRSGGEAPSRRRHGVWGRSPQHTKNFAFFCKNNLILGLFW